MVTPIHPQPTYTCTHTHAHLHARTRTPTAHTPTRLHACTPCYPDSHAFQSFPSLRITKSPFSRVNTFENRWFAPKMQKISVFDLVITKMSPEWKDLGISPEAQFRSVRQTRNDMFSELKVTLIRLNRKGHMSLAALPPDKSSQTLQYQWTYWWISFIGIGAG